MRKIVLTVMLAAAGTLLFPGIAAAEDDWGSQPPPPDAPPAPPVTTPPPKPEPPVTTVPPAPKPPVTTVPPAPPAPPAPKAPAPKPPAAPKSTPAPPAPAPQPAPVAAPAATSALDCASGKIVVTLTNTGNAGATFQVMVDGDVIAEQVVGGGETVEVVHDLGPAHEDSQVQVTVNADGNPVHEQTVPVDCVPAVASANEGCSDAAAAVPGVTSDNEGNCQVNCTVFFGVALMAAVTGALSRRRFAVLRGNTMATVAFGFGWLAAIFGVMATPAVAAIGLGLTALAVRAHRQNPAAVTATS